MSIVANRMSAESPVVEAVPQRRSLFRRLLRVLIPVALLTIIAAIAIPLYNNI